MRVRIIFTQLKVKHVHRFGNVSRDYAENLSVMLMLRMLRKNSNTILLMVQKSTILLQDFFHQSYYDKFQDLGW